MQALSGLVSLGSAIALSDETRVNFQYHLTTYTSPPLPRDHAPSLAHPHLTLTLLTTKSVSNPHLLDFTSHPLAIYPHPVLVFPRLSNPRTSIPIVSPAEEQPRWSRSPHRAARSLEIVLPSVMLTARSLSRVPAAPAALCSALWPLVWPRRPQRYVESYNLPYARGE